MKIEIWSDFTCPYCYLGTKRLNIALDKVGCRDKVDLVFRSFELDSEVEATTTVTKLEMLMNHFSLSLDKVNEMVESLKGEANELGLEIKFDTLQHTNTFHAHRLAKFLIKRHEKEEAIEALFKSYFEDNLNIGRKEVLVDIGVTLGVEEKEVQELLCLNKFSKRIKEDAELAEELGIDNVPFYIFDEEYAVQGLQTIDTFEKILHTLCDHRQGNSQEKPKTTYCEGKQCRRV